MFETLVWACVALCAVAGVWDVFRRATRARVASELEHRIEMAEANAKLALEAAKSADEHVRAVSNRIPANQTRWGRQ